MAVQLGHAYYFNLSDDPFMYYRSKEAGITKHIVTMTLNIASSRVYENRISRIGREGILVN